MDLAIVLDTSRSTGNRAGEGPGFWGYLGPSAPPEETQLSVAAEGILRAAGRMDPSRQAMAVVGFAGAPMQHPDRAAWIEVGLTNQSGAIEAAVERIRVRGPSGSSCHGCAARRAASVLQAERSEDRCQIMLFVADSGPTLPHGPEARDDNVAHLERSIEEAGFRGRVWFVVLDDPEAKSTALLRRMAARVGGEVRTAAGADAVAETIAAASAGCAPRAT